MTDEELTAIRARVDAATPGPWTSYPIGTIGYGVDGAPCGSEGEYQRSDAEFIAHAREDVPALLAEVERLRAKIEELDEEATTWMHRATGRAAHPIAGRRPGREGAVNG